MSDKAADDLAHGSRMVWLIYPDQQWIEILTADVLTGDDVLMGRARLPSFSVPSREIFPPPAQP